ncbi:MAG TPA: S53 family peptidase [Ktedonobacteraceae bacterium]|jgi:kumamolisin|nr:S53 family peptidase [Ktedonobacteraceae bacterium]
MQRFIVSRRTLVPLAIIACLFATVLSAFTFDDHASAHAYASLSGSFTQAPTGAKMSGQHAGDAPMAVSLLLHASNQAQLASTLSNLYNPSSSQYHQWLAKGEFDQLFAPAPSQAAQVRSFLEHAGLTVVASPTPFLERATGTTAQVETAFHTRINNYTAATGESFFQNDSAIQVPSNLSGMVDAVSGLSNTNVLHTHYMTTRHAAQMAGKAIPKYGAGPGGSGLTPSQLAGIYDANPVYQQGDSGKGKGATLAVFELSGYTPNDITTYEHHFFGPSVNVPLVDINVNGGPVTPVCPAGDHCGPFTASGRCVNGCNSADYSGDDEVEADIETQIALAPKADRILVYNAPNDETGLTTINEYFKIAKDDLADSISSSWGACEKDAGLASAKAESMAFAQMAAQGQSMFSASGDTGAFDCLRGSGFKGITADDPTSQPYVTGVGGTSLGTFDPGANQHPAYPTGAETVWNVRDTCNATHLKQCSDLGAGGGGVSNFWGQPSYQSGPGVLSAFSQKGPYCSQAAKGQYCREEPDVSANADEYTPYAEYCTGNPQTNSGCATAPGWFGIGGTSLASPVWSAVIGLWVSTHGKRFGSANYGLYQLLRSPNAYSTFFHDITGQNQTVNNNGYYPTTASYDMATGIGTPRIAGIVNANF